MKNEHFRRGQISSTRTAPVGADAYIRPLAPHQSLPLEAPEGRAKRKVPAQRADEVLAPKGTNASILLKTPFPRRRAARPLATGGIDRVRMSPMVPNGPMWAYFVTLRVRPLRVGR